MFGDGATQGRPVSSKRILRVHPRMGTVRRSQRMPNASLNRSRQLRRSHAVPDGEGVAADERREGRLEHRTLHRRPADGIRPVEDHGGNAGFGRRLHHVSHRVDEGVIAAPDVLQVAEDRVEPLELLGPRPERVRVRPVQARHGQPGLGVGSARDRLHVLSLAPQPVLRPEQSDQAEAGVQGEEVRRVPRRPVHGGRVRDQADPRAGAEAGGAGAAIEEHVEAGDDDRRAPTASWRARRARPDAACLPWASGPPGPARDLSGGGCNRAPAPAS